MAALAHGWAPPKGSGIHIPPQVAIDFNKADAGTGILSKPPTLPKRKKKR